MTGAAQSWILHVGLGAGLGTTSDLADELADTEGLSEAENDAVKVLVSLEVEDVVDESEEGTVVGDSALDDV